jgi:hypothetical protein
MKAEDALILVNKKKIHADPVPEGFEDIYEYLQQKLGLSPESAKEVVHEQAQAHQSPTRERNFS